MSISTLTLMCDIITEHMQLALDQIWIYNQKRNIPNDSRLYVIVGHGGSKPYSSSKHYEIVDSVHKEVHCQKMIESITINLLSANTEALDRVGELIGALSSDYSQEMQVKHGLSIAPMPVNVLDSSAAEVTRELYRTTIDIKILRAYSQSKAIPYYDNISIEISNEEGTNL